MGAFDMNRILLSLIAVVFLLSGPAYAGVPVSCVNCSTNFMDALQQVHNVKELAQLIEQTSQSITQTEAQLHMVVQNMERYANMVQNTRKLPERMTTQVQDNFTRLADLSKQLKTHRGEASALNQIFSATYASRTAIRELASVPRDSYGEAARTYDQWVGKWSDEVDRSQKAQFAASGEQIHEIENEAKELAGKTTELLKTPEGQMQALEAGNTLALMQLQEAQKLRYLLAVTAQASAGKDEKAEKEDQKAREDWKDFLR
jgi:P-type conjugative transfer protein TrbJ